LHLHGSEIISKDCNTRLLNMLDEVKPAGKYEEADLMSSEQLVEALLDVMGIALELKDVHHGVRIILKFALQHSQQREDDTFEVVSQAYVDFQRANVHKKLCCDPEVLTKPLERLPVELLNRVNAAISEEITNLAQDGDANRLPLHAWNSIAAVLPLNNLNKFDAQHIGEIAKIMDMIEKYFLANKTASFPIILAINKIVSYLAKKRPTDKLKEKWSADMKAEWDSTLQQRWDSEVDSKWDSLHTAVAKYKWPKRVSEKARERKTVKQMLRMIKFIFNASTRRHVERHAPSEQDRAQRKKERFEAKRQRREERKREAISRENAEMVRRLAERGSLFGGGMEEGLSSSEEEQGQREEEEDEQRSSAKLLQAKKAAKRKTKKINMKKKRDKRRAEKKAEEAQKKREREETTEETKGPAPKKKLKLKASKYADEKYDKGLRAGAFAGDPFME